MFGDPMERLVRYPHDQRRCAYLLQVRQGQSASLVPLLPCALRPEIEDGVTIGHCAIAVRFGKRMHFVGSRRREWQPLTDHDAVKDILIAENGFLLRRL